MSILNINKRTVPKVARNGRIYTNSGTSSVSSASSPINLIDWATVTPDLVTINRNLHVEGNVTASGDVIAYVASAVTSDVLSSLTVSKPLNKSSNSNIELLFNSEQFEVNTNNELQIKGDSINTKSFVFNQGVPSTVWQINHSLNRYPSIIVVDSAGTTVEGNIQYIDINNIQVTFSAAFSGYAYLN